MTPRNSRPGSALCCAALIFLLTIAPHIGRGQTNAPASAPLPAAAQEAVRKGMIAAQVPDYLLAIRYFEEARKIAPDAPIIFFNLGLAESRIPGRELRAICWFSAYLAAEPKAANAAAVKDQIDILDISSQSNLSRLIKSLQDAAALGVGDNKLGMLRSVAELWGKASDLESALQTADLIQNQSYKSAALSDIAWAQAEAGNIAGAQKTDNLIQDADSKSSALAAIVIAQVRSGDIAAAQKTADLIQGARFNEGAQSYVARRQTTSVETQPSIRTVITVSEWLNKLTDDNKSNDCPLNTGPFLDLAGYVKSLPPADDPQKFFESFRETAEKKIKAQNVIDQMLKQQVVSRWQEADSLELRIPRKNVAAGAITSTQPGAYGTPGEEKVNARDGLKYVWIPAGTFQMGCSPLDKDCEKNERPAHAITISNGFWMGQTEVTQAAYIRVRGHNPSLNNDNGLQLPVDSVSWDAADGYCRAVEMRLPTEAEWEYAARAGGVESRYGELDAISWNYKNTGGFFSKRSYAVGEKQANAWKLYDMLGNVYEWTADWYDENYYSLSPSQDPPGPASGKTRVLRGESYISERKMVRVSSRSAGSPGESGFYIGFRCVGDML